MIKAIYLISSEKDNNIEIYYKINIKKIKKISIYDFEYWIEDILEEEKHYFTDSQYIGFRLVFNIESIS
jgi:5-methylcytosine-specific restriction endonuclease McrBC regulatory subunit McrC